MGGIGEFVDVSGSTAASLVRHASLSSGGTSGFRQYHAVASSRIQKSGEDSRTSVSGRREQL